MRFSMAACTKTDLPRRRLCLRVLLIIPCLWPPLERRTRPVPVRRNRLAAARLVFIFGMASSIRDWATLLR